MFFRPKLPCIPKMFTNPLFNRPWGLPNITLTFVVIISNNVASVGIMIQNRLFNRENYHQQKAVLETLEWTGFSPGWTPYCPAWTSACPGWTESSPTLTPRTLEIEKKIIAQNSNTLILIYLWCLSWKKIMFTYFNHVFCEKNWWGWTSACPGWTGFSPT